MKVRAPVQRVLDAIDSALTYSRTALDIDKLVAARLCLVETSQPTHGSSTALKGQRRAFAKWCPKCERARARGLFNRNAAKRDGMQTICRECQRRVYQEHGYGPGGPLVDATYEEGKPQREPPWAAGRQGA